MELGLRRHIIRAVTSSIIDEPFATRFTFGIAQENDGRKESNVILCIPYLFGALCRSRDGAEKLL